MSSSRLRKNPATLFDVFCEVGSGSGEGAAVILQQYPDDYTNAGILKSLCQFTFPCGIDDEQNEAVQLFSFVLTDADSCYSFGYCRHTPKSNTCLCILSALPWTSLFYQLLNHLASVMNNGTQDELDALLTRGYHTEIPNAGEIFMVESTFGKNKMEIKVPDLNRLPSLREDKHFMEFYNAIPDEKQMIAIFASLLKERRVMITGRKLSQLSSCIFATAALIYPMHWQNVFIPVLPQHLTDMIMAPIPFLIGLPKKTLEERVRPNELNDVVVIDLEAHTFRSPYDDVASIPSDVLSTLRSQLKSSTDIFMSDWLARSFLRAMVMLFGGYRRGIIRREHSLDGNGTQEIRYSWDKQKFISEQKTSLQHFLTALITVDGVQYFERFIDERLKMINENEMVDDEFEKESRLIDTRSVKSSQLMRENASDVFGALKGRVQGIAKDTSAGVFFPFLSGTGPSSSSNASPLIFSGISFKDSLIRDKLGRFTPKESRKFARTKDIEVSKSRSEVVDGESPNVLLDSCSGSSSMLEDPQVKALLDNTGTGTAVTCRFANGVSQKQTRMSISTSLTDLDRKDLIDWEAGEVPNISSTNNQLDPLVCSSRASKTALTGVKSNPNSPLLLDPTSSNVQLLVDVFDQNSGCQNLCSPTLQSENNEENKLTSSVAELRKRWERFD